MRIHRHFLMAYVGLGLGCRSPIKEPVAGPDPTPASSTSSSAATVDATKVSVTLTSSTLEASAQWPSPGVKGWNYPKIELTFTVANSTNAPVACLADVALEIETERAKTKKRAPVVMPSALNVGASSIDLRTVDAGKELTDVAAGYMKGDVLHVKARLRCTAGTQAFDVVSNEVVIHVFVPEG